MYVAFTDFRKAFDSVIRSKLLAVLKKKRSEKKKKVSCHSQYVSCCKEQGSSWIGFDRVVRVSKRSQAGRNMQPSSVFPFYRRLSKYNNATRQTWHTVDPRFDRNFVLLFVANVFLVSDTVCGLQSQLNVLCNTANHLRLVDNLDKSNIIVFRNGKHKALCKNIEGWQFSNENCKCVQIFGDIFIYPSFLSSCTERHVKTS